MDACLSEARAISGKLMTVDEVLEVVKKDSLFYRNSGGGVTASGGEATAQADFLTELFRRCRESGIHTTLDTCGYAQWESLQKVLEYTDLVLFDVKHLNSIRHIELTGVDNELILQNLRNVVQRGIPMRVRMPLIPGCNDSKENIEAVGKFITNLGIKEIDILPYHQLGSSKYTRLGMTYELAEAKSYQEEQVEQIKRNLESFGLEVRIV